MPSRSLSSSSERAIAHGGPDAQASLLPPQKEDDSIAAIDTQMLLVADLEDEYWHAHFFQEPYYVAGRSYDQYRPAYKLGWKSALQHPDANFGDLVKQLEVRWPHQRTTSLLPWREVHVAVRDGWRHAAVQMRDVQQHAPTLMRGHEIAGVIDPLHHACLGLADDLQRMRCIPMSDFAKQVIERHIHMLQRMADGLQSLTPAVAQSPVSPWHKRLRFHWLKLKSNLSEWVPAQVLEMCEFREKNLLSAYQRALRKHLALEAKAVLQSHVKQLQSHVEKLHCVRQSMVW